MKRIKYFFNMLFHSSRQRKERAVREIGFSENWHDVNQPTSPSTRTVASVVEEQRP